MKASGSGFDLPGSVNQTMRIMRESVRLRENAGLTNRGTVQIKGNYAVRETSDRRVREVITSL